MSEFFKKIAKLVLKPLKAIYLNPAFRYKLIFSDTFNAHPDEIMLKKAMEFAAQAKIDGDYLEFGVWKGRSFSRAYNIWKLINNNSKALDSMQFYAFDSFEGLPEIIFSEDQKTGEFVAGQYACSEDDFKKIIARKGVDLTRIKTIKGWFSNTLNQDTKNKLSIKKASIIYVDSDLYASAVAVLDFVTDYVQDGTLIIFDDWFCFRGNPNIGEQKAFREWLAKNPSLSATEYCQFSWKGNSFILHRQ